MLKIYITIGMLYTLYILIGSIILMNKGKESMFSISDNNNTVNTVFAKLVIYTFATFILMFTWPIGIFLDIKNLLKKKSN